MQTRSYAVAPALFLVRLTLDPAAKLVEVSTNHIVVVDCSGSMSSDLPSVREQLKRKLPKMLGEKDTVSFIWFSGRGQFGVLLEGEPVATLADLNDVNKAIDRWLKPVSLTGFKEPLEEADKVIERLAKKHPGSAFSLFFMSDGCDNQWPQADVLEAVEKLCRKLAAATFVEYGYYADRPLLTAMAEKVGGVLIFAQDFDAYAPVFEAAMGDRPLGGKKIEVEVPGDPIGGFAFALEGKNLPTFAVNGGKMLVAEGTSQVWFVNPTPVGVVSDHLPTLAARFAKATDTTDPIAAAYAAVSLFSTRMQPDVVYPFLKALGDVKLIEDMGGCFGKQKYSEFMNAAREAAFDAGKRLTKGYDPSKVPADDAFTVLDLLQLLADNENNRVLLDHPEFKYSRIRRGRTEEALKFTADPAPDGYSISSSVYNEEQPNISIQVRKTGTADISSHVPDSLKGVLPQPFPTFIFRNYAIIKDGLVNVSKLPVKITDETFAKLREAGMVDGDSNQGTYVLDLSALPIINRKMVKATNAMTLFEMEWALTKARAVQKVYSIIKKDKFPRKSESYAILYGAEASAWLKEQGFTDYSGFNPKRVMAEARDFYMAKQLSISIKGFSSIPSLSEFEKQAAKSKLTAGAKLMAPAVKAVQDFLASDVYKTAKNQDKLFETWLDGQLKDAQATVRRLLAEQAKNRFSIIVGQVWIFPTLDEDSLTFTASDGTILTCKAELREVKVEI